jgi:AraC-like DNA-binding protein
MLYEVSGEILEQVGRSSQRTIATADPYPEGRRAVAVGSGRHRSRISGSGWDTTPSTGALVLSAAREELARFVAIIGELDCHAILRSAEESETTLSGSREGLSQSDAVSLVEPIYDASGKPSATLELSVESCAPQGLLRSLLRATTRAITERLFRLHFSKVWVIAGRHPEHGDDGVLLAVDARQNVVGADSNARRLLLGRQGRDGRLPLLASLFALGISRLSHRRADTVLTLNSIADGTPWTLLVTPPGLTAHQTLPTAEALQHARPRLDAFGRANWSIPCDDSLGLPLRLVRRIEEYVDANLDATLNIGNLALKLGVSTSHFARSFREAVGLTPHSYVMQRRLLRAQELLLNTNRSLVEIALVTGFSDQSHFSRRFHQSVGLPPRAFRARRR